MTTRTDYATCMLCEALCGLEVDHDGRKVLKIRGDEQDPFSRGHICPKGVALADLQNDPDRLRRPLRRRGDEWEEISWDEALDEAARRIVDIQARHGKDAVAVYQGNPTGHDYAAVLVLSAFCDRLDTKSRFSASSVDALPRTLVSSLVFGNQAIIPIPDIERTDFMLMLGANPAVSNGSVMTAPDAAKRLREIRKRGGRLVVVDPRRSETAKIADAHYFIRPGTDALLVAALLQVIFAEGLDDPGAVAEHMDGWDQIPVLVMPFTPEAVAPHVGIAADEIAALAHEFAAAPSAVCYGRMGTCVQEFGLVASWLVDILNIATGNFDRPGGAMFPTPAVDLAELANKVGQPGHFDRWRSRVAELPEFNGELPVATFAEEIETPGPGQIRALVTHAGNPVLSLPNGRRLDRAFEGLDFMVSIDIYLNETTRHADLILPPTFGLEQDSYGVLAHGTATRNTAHYSPAILEKPEGSLHGWEILARLTGRIGREQGLVAGFAARATEVLYRAIEPRNVLRVLFRMGPQDVTLGDLEKQPHGIDLGPLEPRLPGNLPKGQRIRIAPVPITRDVPRLVRRLEQVPAPRSSTNGLLLVGRRHLRSNNSWMHNSELLVKGSDRCVLIMHPEDAAERGLLEGQRVVLKSRVGEVEVPLHISDEMMPGVVSLPHGWGHSRKGARMAVAGAHPGVSYNDVVDESVIDPACGTSVLNGLPVSVTSLDG